MTGAKLSELGPFYHDVDLGDGRSTAPDTHLVADLIDQFFPPLLSLCGGSLEGKRVLDLGCNCGGLSFAAWRAGATEVVGVDARERHITQADAIKGHLGASTVHFRQARVEDLSRDELGSFDICFAAGILYHLSNPLAVFAKISELTESLILVDSHVHYDANPSREDIPSWWMLTDTDTGDIDGLRVDHDHLSTERYSEFEREHPVDYSLLPGLFIPSPQSARDLAFARACRPNRARGPVPDSAFSDPPGELVLVPNERALIRALRRFGFEDILKVMPHRFAPEPYLLKYRVGLLGLKRASRDGVRLSEWGARGAWPD
jgi:SAM-dependent methyltransferase